MILKFIYIFVLMDIKKPNFTLILNSLKKLREKKGSHDKLFAKTLFLVTAIEVKIPFLYVDGQLQYF